MAFVVITNSTIQNHGQNGIHVAEGATARIGFEYYSDALPSANTISANAQAGILIGYNSTAQIYNNIISNNTLRGVRIENGSSAHLSNNTINSNGTGIVVVNNSSAQLGFNYPPTGMADYPNYTTALNANVGIWWSNGGVVTGHLGSTNQVNGANFQFGGSTINGVPANAFAANCATKESDLAIP